MNIKILLLMIPVVAATGCSTAYKGGQTPDDVYYSPARYVEETATVERKQETVKYRNEQRDRHLVMSIYDRRWRYFNDDYNSFYDPYRYGYNCGYYYNPYYYSSPVYITGANFINPKNTVPRMANLGSYYYTNMEVINPKNGTTTVIRSGRQYNNSNTSGLIRRIITPSNNHNTYSNQPSNSYQPSDNNTRTYTPSSGSSSGSSSGNSGTPVARPHRGG